MFLNTRKQEELSFRNILDQVYWKDLSLILRCCVPEPLSIYDDEGGDMEELLDSMKMKYANGALVIMN